MDEAEALEQRMTQLQSAIRAAARAGAAEEVRNLRAELRAAQRAWDEVYASLAQASEEPEELAPSLSLREQAHQALTLLGVPAAPRLLSSTHEAFFGARLPAARMSSLRRDEQRSFQTAPYARPYYVCSALTADMLSAARGLLALSSWPLEKRIVGPLSARVDFLVAAIRLAEEVARLAAPPPAAWRLVWQFAVNVPDGVASGAKMPDPQRLVAAARAELDVHEATDRATRSDAAARARDQLGDADQLFGAQIRTISRTAAT